MKAVHFGAGEVGRGVIGLLLHEAGYELVFSDTSPTLVDAINATKSYTVHEVGEGGRNRVVTGFRAIDSAAHPAAVIDEIAGANIVTTSVGASMLPSVAPTILAGLALRDPSSPPLQIMACENTVNATDILRDRIRERADDAWDAVAGRAVFANTAVHRVILPSQNQTGVDVAVEPVFEWAIERAPFGGIAPAIPGAHFVRDLTPYIPRALSPARDRPAADEGVPRAGPGSFS